jgi:hypothetical protein
MSHKVLSLRSGKNLQLPHLGIGRQKDSRMDPRCELAEPWYDTRSYMKSLSAVLSRIERMLGNILR